MKDIAIKAPDWLRRNAIYQINPRTFSKDGTINAISEELPFLKQLGFNIIYLCPIFEEDASEDENTWSVRQIASETGNPKNQYRMNDYFNIDEEFGVMDDLKKLVERAHELDMKVLLDLVYAHMGPQAPILKRHPEFVKQNHDGSFVLTRWKFPALDFRSEGLREYLYCNMVYYISVIDVDGFRLDVGDLIPIDFWKEARRRIRAVKKDAVLIQEGIKYEYMVIAHDSCYCFEWHEMLRAVYCGDEPASRIKAYSRDLVGELPEGSKVLRDIDNHDTVTDWDGRTETLAGHNGMEQIEVLNYLADGIPMVYSGNELACTAHLSMFANRFHMGKFEATDRTDKTGKESLRRQQIIKTLNKMKAESDLLCFGQTEWLDIPEDDSVIAFKRIYKGKEILFIGNTKNKDVDIDVKDLLKGKSCILHNGDHAVSGNILHLCSYEYVVFE